MMIYLEQNITKKNEDDWFHPKFYCQQIRICNPSDDKLESEIDIFSDIPMTPKQHEDLQVILASELKEYILDHYWYNRTIMRSSHES